MPAFVWYGVEQGMPHYEVLSLREDRDGVLRLIVESGEEQRRLLAAWSARAHSAEIERPQRPDFGSVPQAWRQRYARIAARRAFPIRGSE